MNKIYGVVYIVTCSVNGKQYVGQTREKKPSRRFDGHLDGARKGGKLLLSKAIRKYGEDQFSFAVIWVAFDKMVLDEAEDHYIMEFNTLAPNGYNLRRGGARGRLHPSSIEKIRNNTLKQMAALTPDQRRETMEMARKSITPEIRRQGSIKANASRTPEQRLAYIRIAISAIKPEDMRRRARAIVQNMSVEQLSDRARKANASRSAEQRSAIAKKARSYLTPEQMSLSVSKGLCKRTQEQRLRGIQKALASLTTERRRANALGRRWITDGLESRQLKPGETLKEGWRYGRK